MFCWRKKQDGPSRMVPDPLLNEIRRCRGPDVAWDLVVSLPGVQSSSMSTGWTTYYSVTMWDGKRFLDSTAMDRSPYKRHLGPQTKELQYVRRMARRVCRYYRGKDSAFADY